MMMPRLPVDVTTLPHGTGLALPVYQTAGSAGCDLYAAISDDLVLQLGERALIPTGIAFALPHGVEAQIRPRSGLAIKHGITVLNSPGTIDSDYRGEIRVPIINLGDQPYRIQRGDRIAQIVFAKYTQIEWNEVSELSASGTRDDGGFGSTGR